MVTSHRTEPWTEAFAGLGALLLANGTLLSYVAHSSREPANGGRRCCRPIESAVNVGRAGVDSLVQVLNDMSSRNFQGLALGSREHAVVVA